MVVTPVLANLCIRSSFVLSCIAFFSFWSPSRGPTSTIRTRVSGAGRGVSVAVAKLRKLRRVVRRRARRAIGAIIAMALQNYHRFGAN